MDIKIFSIYDSKLEAYLQPFFMKSAGQAIRGITDAANNEQSEFHKHPADYTLFEIGSFNEESGTIKTIETQINLGNLLHLTTTEQ